LHTWWAKSGEVLRGSDISQEPVTKNQKRISILIWIGLFILIWETIAFIMGATKRTPENFLPHLLQIITNFNTEIGDTTAIQMVLDNTGVTLLRSGLGYLVGTVVGFGLAILMRMYKPIEKIAFPYLMMIQMIPILGMAPILLSVSDNIDTARTMIAAILTFYPVATSTLAGLKSVEKEKLDLMHALNASKTDTYTKLLIPASMPFFFTGLKVAAPMAITASILVDTLQGSAGLGTILSQSLKGGFTRYVFWQIVFVSAIIGILSFQLIALIERLVSPQVKAGRS
jgi:ABC-type nitrate/sulfonate/bicarbonate transport system permease component